MKVAIAGGTGFIGSLLTQHFLENGDDVIVISRKVPKVSGAGNNQGAGGRVKRAENVTWGELLANAECLEGLEAIVNLAGETINQRWTEGAKLSILQSRLDVTGQVALLVDKLRSKPKVVVNASGISIYGTSEKDTFDENSPSQVMDFLSGVVKQWEQAADAIVGTRVVKLRVGVVLGSDGGAFPKMAMPYKLFVGGKVGSGKQWLSWIHIDDMIRLIDYCIRNEAIHGPVNAVAPNPVTNAEFGRALGNALHRPNLFPVPAFVMRLMFGELSELLLKGQKIIPQVALDHGFMFNYPAISEALRQLVDKPNKLD